MKIRWTVRPLESVVMMREANISVMVDICGVFLKKKRVEVRVSLLSVSR